MRFDSISINNFRKIKQTQLNRIAETNLICGPNGSGKTTVLEAIHMLSMARSFRTFRTVEIITHGEDSLLVTARLASADGRVFTLGVQKGADRTQIKINGEAVNTASQLSRLVPVVLLNAESHVLLDGGPANRRALIDRTLFHVEQSYLMVWKAYYHALKQRNALLRMKAPSVNGSYWNREIGKYARMLDAARASCIEALNNKLRQSKVSSLFGVVNLDYRRGWGEGDLSDKLDGTWGKDIALGTTNIGPHRAEVRVMIGSELAAPNISRGQGKLVLVAILATQASFIFERCGKKPVMLIDDLASELDDGMRYVAVRSLLAVEGQIFFTAVDERFLPELERLHRQMFHVEHGGVRAVLERAE